MEGPVSSSENMLDYLCFRLGLIETLVLVDMGSHPLFTE